MKRLFIINFLFILLSFQIFSQTNDSEKINDEYYGLKWGSSITELKAKYPNAYAQGTNDQGDELYYLDTNGATRIFFFGNGKLYMGRVAYEDCTDEKAIALMTKLTDTYGKFDDSTKGSQNGNEYIVLTKYFSKKISISLQVTTIKNSYGYNISQMVFIDTLNKDLQATIAKKRIDKMQDDLEL